MNFAGIGPAELLVILIIALLVFGPSKLPEIARDLGRSLQKWREALDDITGDALSQTPSSPAREEEMQAAVQKVAPGAHKIDKAAGGSDEPEDGEDAEVETECQT